MRDVSYTCDKCGRKMASRSATKMDVTLRRGVDSMEKKTYDFCSTCFLKMKKAWGDALTETGAAKQPAANGPEPETVVPEPKTGISEPVMSEPKTDIQEPDNENRLEPAREDGDKKRGRRPKEADPKEYTGRTELFSGPIRPNEKEYILKLYVEENMSPKDIAEKIHRVPKGIKRTIGAALQSGELDRLQKAFDEKKQAENKREPQEDYDVKEPQEDYGVPVFSGFFKKSSYLKPAKTETIDGRKYDIGGILALHNAGWPPSKIAGEKGYDEDQVRVILEGHTSAQP